MNKTTLCGGLLSLLSSMLCAENTSTSTEPQQAPTSQTSTSSTTNTVNPPSSATTTTVTTTTSVVPPQTIPSNLDCNYHIPAETKQIDSGLVSKWAEKAAQQSFAFDHMNLTNQLMALKVCYTDQGWQSFNNALQKSGNMNAIQTQKLNVSSLIDGQTTINEMKENQWKVTVPLNVVYQNDKEKLTQSLTIDLMVGRKITGDLGIMQMIAAPRQADKTGLETTNNMSQSPQ